jgi:hypothetical protein
MVLLIAHYCRPKRSCLRGNNADQKDEEGASTADDHDEASNGTTVYVASKDHKSANFFPVELPMENSPSQS